MNEQLKEKAGLVYNIVESVILLMSVGLIGWVCNVVIIHGNTLAQQSTMIATNNDRLNRLELGGSPNLKAHVQDDDRRVDEIGRRLDKVESAVILLQSAPAELKAINARLDGIKESQSRIEKAMDNHLSKP